MYQTGPRHTTLAPARYQREMGLAPDGGWA